MFISVYLKVLYLPKNLINHIQNITKKHLPKRLLIKSTIKIIAFPNVFLPFHFSAARFTCQIIERTYNVISVYTFTCTCPVGVCVSVSVIKDGGLVMMIRCRWAALLSDADRCGRGKKSGKPTLYAFCGYWTQMNICFIIRCCFNIY